MPSGHWIYYWIYWYLLGTGYIHPDQLARLPECLVSVYLGSTDLTHLSTMALRSTNICTTVGQALGMNSSKTHYNEWMVATQGMFPTELGGSALGEMVCFAAIFLPLNVNTRVQSPWVLSTWRLGHAKCLKHQSSSIIVPSFYIHLMLRGNGTRHACMQSQTLDGRQP